MINQINIMDDNQDNVNNINEILTSIHLTVKNGSIGSFKDLIQRIHTVENKKTLHTYITDTELISMICKYNRKKHLKYILYESDILHCLISENKSIENECKMNAFYYAMCSNSFDVLEMLYDFWSGDLHWLGHRKEYDKFDIENLKQLKCLLQNAFNMYQNYIQLRRKINIQHILDIESLIAFNNFQIDLYTELNKLKAGLITWEDEPDDIVRIQETYALKKMILLVFDTYEKHSEQSLLEHCILELDDTMDSYLDNSSLYHKTRLFLFYEVFFRKLDYNFCLLILDNLHLLKLRLSMPKNSYQEIENKLYYLIYHISNKWNLYLPKRKKNNMIKVSVLYRGQFCCFSFVCTDSTRENIYNTIHLERREFQEVIKCFGKKLRIRSVEENIRNAQIKLPNEDNNCLMLLPHLRDDYSLKRISQHIAQLHSVNFKFENKYMFLFIERTLQIVGEFLKSTDESLHLQQSTEALVKAEISVAAVNDLKALRSLLCHAKKGELLKRIEIEENYSHIFNLILKELLYVKKKIDDVIKTHKPIVERDLLQNVQYVLRNRINEMPENVAMIHYNLLEDITLIPIDFIRREAEKEYFENTWLPQKLSKSLMTEVSMVADHATKLNFKVNRLVKNIFNNVLLKFPFYKERIQNSLKMIMAYIKKWRGIVQILKNENSAIVLSDYPNEEDANRIKSYSNKVLVRDDTLIQPGEVHDLFANVENHWKFIENLFEFIIIQTRILDNTIEELKFSMYTYNIKQLRKCKYRSNDMEKNVTIFLHMIETKLNDMKVRKSSNSVQYNVNTADSDKIPDFTGIKEFTNKLMTANMLTREEKGKLIRTIESATVKKYSTVKLIIHKIETDTAIPKKDYTNYIQILKLDNKSQKMLMNLVMGHKRNPLLPQCLSKRLVILREIFNQQPSTQLLLRYKSDKTFRVLLEVLLFDIFTIMESNKTNPFLRKSNKLLTEINLRNILTHGSPLLEIVGNVLDANDLPTELISRALDFIEDEKSINALCALSELDYDFTEINNITQNSKYISLIDELKMSCRWRDYLNLIPEYKQKNYEKQKKIPSIDEKSMELLKAVKEKDAALVEICVGKGADVNFVDNHKKAVIHYAAMNGSVNVLEVLLNNGADVNILNKDNNLTALHYSAMNNFIDSVKFLLANGANCRALDNKGRTPVYWASQRKHDSVCKVLIQTMKECD